MSETMHEANGFPASPDMIPVPFISLETPVQEKALPYSTTVTPVRDGRRKWQSFLLWFFLIILSILSGITVVAGLMIREHWTGVYRTNSFSGVCEIVIRAAPSIMLWFVLGLFSGIARSSREKSGGVVSFRRRAFTISTISIVSSAIFFVDCLVVPKIWATVDILKVSAVHGYNVVESKKATTISQGWLLHLPWRENLFVLRDITFSEQFITPIMVGEKEWQSVWRTSIRLNYVGGYPSAVPLMKKFETKHAHATAVKALVKSSLDRYFLEERDRIKHIDPTINMLTTELSDAEKKELLAWGYESPPTIYLHLNHLWSGR